MASAWTDEIIEAMKLGFNAGQSAGWIADEINAQYGTQFSRNAIIGKLHRHGLRREGSHSPQWSRPRTARKTRAPRRVNQKRSVKWTPEHGIEHIKTALTEILDMDAEAIAARVRADAEIPQAQRKTLMRLTADDCRWPVGDPGKPDFFFCGSEVVPGRSYCSYHCHRAYQPNSARSPRPLLAAMTNAPTMYSHIIDRDFEVV
jgi:GcrA cell cycle regulator